ncbi:hypothetical protein [Rhizobium sp. Root482]|uniref:hypothetical protein n=1 Tax=Rhizobium sp. Root482 TaxID=1736543 RepID=UPI0006FBB3D3|nr:hypothetical protein [Rhizobium sp. Root482]KQY21087.1 hypothetical protein ASD31_23325 [Rhizobium sp. Root482]
MKLNHFSNRVEDTYFDIVVEMLKTELGFIELRRTERSIWMRQAGANVDLQFSRSEVVNRDADKRGSQVAFLSEAPRADLERLVAWLRGKGLDATVGQWSDKEFFLDVPAAFIDFVIEAITPDIADYDISTRDKASAHPSRPQN